MRTGLGPVARSFTAEARARSFGFVLRTAPALGAVVVIARPALYLRVRPVVTAHLVSEVVSTVGYQHLGRQELRSGGQTSPL